MTNLSSLQQKNQQNFTKHLQKEVVIFDRTHLRILEGNFLDVGEFNLSYFIAQIPLAIGSTRHDTCILAVSTLSNNTARLARHDELDWVDQSTWAERQNFPLIAQLHLRESRSPLRSRSDDFPLPLRSRSTWLLNPAHRSTALIWLFWPAPLHSKAGFNGSYWFQIFPPTRASITSGDVFSFFAGRYMRDS